MSLEQRVAELEQQNRRWKKVGLFTIFVAMLGVTMGASRWCCGTLTANRFVLVDAFGNQRGEWTFNENEPVLRLYGSNPDESKRSLALLGISPINQKAAFVSLHGDKHKNTVVLEATETTSTASVNGFADHSSEDSRVEMTASSVSTPELQVSYAGRVRVRNRALTSESEVTVISPNGDTKSLKIP